MTGVDAQSLETRRFQIEEVCRFARVSPIMVYGSDKASTYAGSSANFLAHLVHTLSPWYQRLEQSMDKNLLTERERSEGLYFNFVEEGLLRANMIETKDVLLGYVNGGLMTPNEGRAKLDLDPVDDDDADELRIPVNVVQEIEPTGDTPGQEIDDAEQP
jgi:HK97 family phage portal protein